MYRDCLSQDLLVVMLGGMFSGSGGGVKIHLFTAGTPSPASQIEDFSEPEGSWYSPASGVMGAVYDSPDGATNITCPSVQFNYSGSDPSETIVGYFVTDSSNTILHSARTIEPVIMADSLSACVVEPVISLPAVPQAS